MWGRKVCSICSSPDQNSVLPGSGVRLSRTGVCIQCDAGLCKSFFHASCAHAAGLLSEPTYEHHGGHVDDSYLAHCKIHSDRETIRKRRRSFMIHHLQSRKKGEDIKDRMGSTAPLSPARRLSSRSVPGKKNHGILKVEFMMILSFLRRDSGRKNSQKTLSQAAQFPERQIKIPRFLASDAKRFPVCWRRRRRRFERSKGSTKSRVSIWRDKVVKKSRSRAVTEAKKKWHVPPAFSVEFRSLLRGPGAKDCGPEGPGDGRPSS